MIYGFALFGHELPAPGVAVAIVVLMVGAFFASRGSGEGGERVVGHGRMHRCPRCGRDFQIEQVELLSSGDVRRWIDDRCPNCGWDLDWGSPNKPGGSSGTW